MDTLLHNDIQKLLFSISVKYNLDFKLLQLRYLPTISIEQKKFKIKRNHTHTTKRTRTLLLPKYRCTARIWDHGHVLFNTNTNKWTYGSQCKRKPSQQSSYCSTHINVISRNCSLSHGDFYTHPPHSHYEKFKLKTYN